MQFLRKKKGEEEVKDEEKKKQVHADCCELREHVSLRRRGWSTCVATCNENQPGTVQKVHLHLDKAWCRRPPSNGKRLHQRP